MGLRLLAKFENGDKGGEPKGFIETEGAFAATEAGRGASVETGGGTLPDFGASPENA